MNVHDTGILPVCLSISLIISSPDPPNGTGGCYHVRRRNYGIMGRLTSINQHHLCQTWRTAVLLSYDIRTSPKLSHIHSCIILMSSGWDLISKRCDWASTFISRFHSISLLVGVGSVVVSGPRNHGSSQPELYINLGAGCFWQNSVDGSFQAYASGGEMKDSDVTGQEAMERSIRECRNSWCRSQTPVLNFKIDAII